MPGGHDVNMYILGNVLVPACVVAKINTIGILKICTI